MAAASLVVWWICHVCALGLAPQLKTQQKRRVRSDTDPSAIAQLEQCKFIKENKRRNARLADILPGSQCTPHVESLKPSVYYKPDASHFDIQMSQLSTSVCQEAGLRESPSQNVSRQAWRSTIKEYLDSSAFGAQHFLNNNPTNSQNIEPNHYSHMSLPRIRLGSDAHLDLMAQLRQRGVSNFIPTCHITAPRARTLLDIHWSIISACSNVPPLKRPCY